MTRRLKETVEMVIVSRRQRVFLVFELQGLYCGPRRAREGCLVEIGSSLKTTCCFISGVKKTVLFCFLCRTFTSLNVETLILFFLLGIIGNGIV